MKKFAIILMITIAPLLFYGQARVLTIHTTRPTVDDDLGAGYYTGNLWLKTTDIDAETASGDTLFVCKDPAIGAAEWQFTATMDGATGFLAISDTAAMLAPYITRGDTAVMLDYINTDIAERLLISDTANMLLHYALLSEVGTGSGSIDDGFSDYSIPLWDETNQKYVTVGSGYFKYDTANQRLYASTSSNSYITAVGEIWLTGIKRFDVGTTGIQFAEPLTPMTYTNVTVGSSATPFYGLYINGTSRFGDGSAYGTGTGITFQLASSEIYESADGFMVYKAGSQHFFETKLGIGPSAFSDIAGFTLFVDGRGDIDSLQVDGKVYGTAWNGSNYVPTKDAIYDKIESMADGITINNNTGNNILTASGSANEVDGEPSFTYASGTLNMYDDGGTAAYEIETYNSTLSNAESSLQFYKFNGSKSSYSAVGNGTDLGTIYWYGSDGASSSLNAAEITVLTASSFAVTPTSRMQFKTRDAGSLTTALEINEEGDLEVNGTLVMQNGVISDNDATPDVSAGNVWRYNGTANAVVVTDLDNPVVGAIYYIYGNSDTYTLTINTGGNFRTSKTIELGLDDSVQILCIADNDYLVLASYIN